MTPCSLITTVPPFGGVGLILPEAVHVVRKVDLPILNVPNSCNGISSKLTLISQNLPPL
jgi:hypothetical protein